MTRTLTLKNRFQGNTTIVENDFIDNYLAKANGEYVKVYLLLLRHLNGNTGGLSISGLADCLECTEKDILRAFKHWSKEGLLNIDYDEAGNICGLAVGKSASATASTTAPSTDTPAVAPKRKKPHSELKQLYFIAETYMKKTLTASDVEKLNYFLDTLHFPTDLIEYLIEYCAENGHRNMKYIETVALSWADDGIKTAEEAKIKTSLYTKHVFSIIKAFGIKGRSLGTGELSYIKKWTDEYGFTLDIILEACNRTINNTHNADFKYTDSILTNWHTNGVRHIADIAQLDTAFRQEQDSKKRTAKKATASSNRFNNFEGRPYDITSLEQQLLNSN